MGGSLVAGVDCSTQSTKVLLVDPDDGRVVASGRAAHEVTGRSGARETDPEAWWRALGAALRQTGRAGDVAAVSVAGQQHGLVVLDGDGRPLRPAMLWNDTRAAADARRLREAFGGEEAWADAVGVVPVASFTVSKWAWLARTEPATVAATRAVRLPHDYLTQQLTGAGVTDRGDASGTGWWSTRDDDYVDAVLDLPAVSLPRDRLPRVLAPTDVAGEVSPAAAREVGLPAGTVVGPGTGDNMGAALGLGLAPGTPVVSLGTSGTAYAVSRTRVVDPSGVVAGFADATNRFLPLAATLNCTIAVDRIAALLGLDRGDVAAGSACVVLPYLDGERTPDAPHAAGSVLGVRHATTPQEILRAGYDGAAASLLDALDALDRHSSGLDPDAPLVLIGGGARGAAWQDVFGRLSGRALALPEADELVALGAAVQAASVLRDEQPASVARRWDTRHGRTVPARPPDRARLDQLREVRQRLEDLNAATLFA
jgi:xylulokinase